jgi:UDP-N-acetylglucosamine/UDP-N-acetylgalactosamine diphosphorylase
VCGVDNVLVKIAHPSMIGYAIKNNLHVVNKVVLKEAPHEKVGVMCLRKVALKEGASSSNDSSVHSSAPNNNQFELKAAVIEYSEMDAQDCSAVDEKGVLLYNAGNIANHLFTVDFLKLCADREQDLEWHVARKKIPFVNAQGKTEKPDKENGIKMEMFVFDVFQFAAIDKVATLAVSRADEFTAVKNKSEHEVTGKFPTADSPDSARIDMSNFFIRLVSKAGGKVDSDSHTSSGNSSSDSSGKLDESKVSNLDRGLNVLEISPLLTYEGEDLDLIVKGKTISLPCYLDERTTTNKL